MSWFEREISTAALASEDVPSPDGPLDLERDEPPPIWRFATTYRPPPSLPEALPEFVLASGLAHWKAHNELPELGIDGFRLVLWWLFHHWRHEQSEGVWERNYPERAELARALVKRIHLELYQEESWWWEPQRQPTDDERWQRALRRSTEVHDLAEFYDLAADVLSQAIARQAEGEGDPLNLPLIEEDPHRATRVHTAYLIARGLVDGRTGASLDDARDTAYSTAASLRG